MIRYQQQPISLSLSERADVLIEALPYLREFAGKTIVIKYGGNAMTDEGLKESVVQDIALLQYVGLRPILVHGGGPEIDSLMKKCGQTAPFVNGLRVTDTETIELVEMALSGKANKSLVALLNQHGAKAVGLSGKDADLIVARKLELDGFDYGHVGEILGINSAFIQMLSDQGYIPVICSVAVGQKGETYNVNADSAAGAIAAALQATKLVVLTDVPGVYADLEDDSSLITELDVNAANKLISEGSIGKGMIPKLEACIAAIQSGVPKAHLIDGRRPHALLIELFSDAGIGTMIVPNTSWRQPLNEDLMAGVCK